MMITKNSSKALHGKTNVKPQRMAVCASVVAAAVSAVLAGCTLAPTYERPAEPVAGQWPSAQPAATAASAASSTASNASASANNASGIAAADMPWQDFVQDARLRQLIDLSLQNNRDLRVAIKNIELARAQYRIIRADLAPTLGANVNGSRMSPNPAGNPSVASNYTAGFGINAWEVDFFGRLRSLSNSASAKYLATEEARKAAQISLIGAVSSTWLNLQANTELLALAERTLHTRQQSLALIKQRKDVGIASELDLQQAESLAASAKVAASQQLRLRAQDINALTLLLGQTVPEQLLPATAAKDDGKDSKDASQTAAKTATANATTAKSAPVDSLSQFAPVAVGLPSEVLLRRPDIRAAEQQLIAANANIGAARAAFFPRIALTGMFGRASSELDNLFDGVAVRTWSFLPQISLPIFDWGRNIANLDASHAGRDIALAQYEKAIQTAFREVADALAGRATLGDQIAAQQAQARAERQRYHLADLRYRNGVDSHLGLLDAQRALFGSEQALIQIRLMERINQVELYKTLGGGWMQPVAAQTASSNGAAPAPQPAQP